MFIAIGYAREAGVVGAVVAGEAAVRQRISEGIANRLARDCRASEITFAAGIAPGSVWVPVPGLDCKLGVLTIAYGLPAGSEHSFERSRLQVFINRLHRDAIDARAQGLVGHKAIGGMARSDVDLDGLSSGDGGCEKN